jgi:hypothetical protein
VLDIALEGLGAEGASDVRWGRVELGAQACRVELWQVQLAL